MIDVKAEAEKIQMGWGILNPVHNDYLELVERVRAEEEERTKELAEALELTAVRWTPALDGYCWCSRKGEPSAHKPYCLIAKSVLASKAKVEPKNNYFCKEPDCNGH